MESNWHIDFFRDVALEYWRRAVPATVTRSEADFLEKIFGPAPKALLDVPCGNGRHAVELAGRGYLLTGVDASEEYIAEARAASPQTRWVLGDMCDLPWEEEFHGAYCLGNSFCYLDGVWGARSFLAAVAGALKPGGKFVVATGMVAESILPSLGKGRWHRMGDMIVLSENQYHAAESRLDIQYTFIQHGKVETRPSSSYCFTVAELCRMHAAAGLDVVELLGSVGGEAYQLGSLGLWMVSEKRAAKPPF